MLGRGLFKGLGWKLVGEFPNHPKMIVAVAPHTSNIDFLLAARFNATSRMVLGITPEGTRGKVQEWKKGFAMIARAANATPRFPQKYLHSGDK